MKKSATIVVAALASVFSAGAELVTYPAPDGVKMNDSFSVEVRQGDGNWTELPVYRVMVDEVTDRHRVSDVSMAYFDFSGVVDVRVVARSRKVESARVRPLSYDITPDVCGDTLMFSLDRPRLLSVEVNGEIFDNLQLFANPIDANRPENLKKFRKGKKNIYFGPGLHKLDGELRPADGTTVYIDGGAFIDGKIVVENADNVNIYGRGMVYPAKTAGIEIRNSRNVNIDGIFTTQCPVGGSDGVTITNTKVMSYYGWGDGFNVFASNNVRYSNIFARTSDDCTTVYATRKGFNGGCSGILTENAVLWADVAHPFMIGIHGSAAELGVEAAPDTIRDVVYRNIDVLDMKEKQIDYQGVFAIICGDNNYVRDITFEDIRVEDFRQGKLFDIRIPFNQKYCAAPGSSIENITFRDIVYNGDRSELSLIIGYDESRAVDGIHFENLMINGVRIYDKMPGKPGWYKTGDMARIFIGEHVRNVTFE